MITVHKITGEIGTIGVSIVIDTAEDVEAFKKLIFRGANLWPDAPASIKTFSDELEQGHAWQDYSKQDTSVKTCVHKWIRNPLDDTMTCVKCQLSRNYGSF